MQVNANNFQNYVSGIYDATKSQCNPNGVNHLVLIVGYGYDSASKKNYWLIKNSYGSSWGKQLDIMLNKYLLLSFARRKKIIREKK